MRTWRASRSASENTATVASPASRQARITRTAISPRLAIRTLLMRRSPRGAGSLGGDASRTRSARQDLQPAEEVRDLEGRGIRRVGAVHRVGLDRRREVLADRPRCRLGGIVRAHYLAQPPD